MGEIWEHELPISIHSFYLGEERTGIRTCEKILSKKLPYNIENSIKNNYVFYMPLLSDIIDINYIKLDIEPFAPGWSLFNPTILRHNGEYLVLVRSSNYQIVNGRYNTVDTNGDILTRYKMARISDDGRIYDIRLLNGPDYKKSEFPADGPEDLRLFSIKNKLFVSGTIRNMQPYTDRARISICELDTENATLSNIRLVESPISKERHEKNWMPIIGSDSNEFLYSCNDDGWTVIVDENNGNSNVTHKSISNISTNEYRGGSQVISYDGGYICIIHEVVILHNGLRNYFHRFVKLNQRMQITDISLPFFLKERQIIEFVAGMAYDKTKDVFYVSFGVKDAKAWVAVMPSKSVERMFNLRKEILNEDRSLRNFKK